VVFDLHPLFSIEQEQISKFIRNYSDKKDNKKELF